MKLLCLLLIVAVWFLKNIHDSTRYWIKGNRFTLPNLVTKKCWNKIKNPYKDGASLMISRLAPQDYHRFHWPVSGKVKSITHIGGKLWTVNPIAINQIVNVYTEINVVLYY
eukprot:UN26243